MSDPKPQLEILPVEAALDGSGVKASAVVRVLRFFGKLRAWAAGHWLRSVAVAGTILLLIASTMAGWAYLASVALRSGDLSIDVALRALDDGRFEEARAIVGRMLKSGRLERGEYGGPLFVLGAVKTYEAGNQASTERRRIDYLVASRYLKEARTYGIPLEREPHGLFMLGKSLVESGQFDEGIETLNELLKQKLPDDNIVVGQTHQLLASTCLFMPQPNPEKAFQHNEALLGREDLPEGVRAGSLLLRAECLTRLGRFDEARQAAALVPIDSDLGAVVALLQGKIELDEINATLQRIATQDRQKVINDSTAKIAGAMQFLQQAKALDKQTTRVSRQSSYYIGRCLDLQGDTAGAVKQLARTRQQFTDTLEGLAAALAEADLRRQQADYDAALVGYRRVLESFTNQATYRSVVLPLGEVRSRMMAALKHFVEQKRFADALALLEHFPPLFSRSEQLELRGDTLEQWGNQLLAQASENDPQASDDRSAGLRHLRAAGVAFEQLAELRFATKFYTGDLWHGAETYFRGHSFSSTVRLLNQYLDYEPERRNAEAHLRLGQAHLALGQIPQSIAAFEECIEFHPLASATYQARIDCAKAYWNQGNMSRAEQLLRDNISGSALKPISREWKDSLFELGMLLHEMGRHEEAIGTLEEAVERYPQDSQRLVAQYLIGESYRRWAQELLDRVAQSRTGNERDRNREASSERLQTALAHFEEVQRTITLKTHDIHGDPLMGSMLRNCYMLEGSVLFDLGRYKEAIEAYSNVSSLYPDEPFVLETFVQIANCWRRLDRSDKARGAIQQAQIALERLPTDADFTSATALKRDEWRSLLADMSQW